MSLWYIEEIHNRVTKSKKCLKCMDFEIYFLFVDFAMDLTKLNFSSNYCMHIWPMISYHHCVIIYLIGQLFLTTTFLVLYWLPHFGSVPISDYFKFQTADISVQYQLLQTYNKFYKTLRFCQNYGSSKFILNIWFNFK